MLITVDTNAKNIIKKHLGLRSNLSNIKTPGKNPRVLLYSDGGLQAGDLAALLIKDYETEIITTSAGLKHALLQAAKVLIIFLDRSPFCQSDATLVEQAMKKWKTQVLIFGGSGPRSGIPDSPLVSCFFEIPNCQVILDELAPSHRAEKEAR